MSISPRRVFIGDVHGHYQALMLLLNAIAPTQEDQIYLLGDLIDRGPDSAAVVEYVRNSPYVCLMGNHEQLMLAAFAEGQVQQTQLLSWFYCGGRETVISYRNNTHRLLEDIAWMQTLPTHLDLGDVWLVHAGLDPSLSLTEQTAEQFCWVRTPFHQMQTPYFSDKVILTGHTITFTLPGVRPGDLAQGYGWLDIDTGAYHPQSGWMTALDWTQQMVYQVNVFNHQIRTRPLAEAVTRINPQAVKHR